MSDTPASPRKFSFNRPGAAPAVPVEDPKAAPVATTPAVASPETALTDVPRDLPAVPPTYQPPAFYTGEEDEPFDPIDQRLPRLNIVQKSSQAEWLKLGVGSLILKGEVLIAAVDQPCRFIVAGARPKVWIEKTKYLSPVKARIARSIDEVVKFGGTDLWRFSKENDKISSVKPWFMPSVTLALLVEKPAGLRPEHEAHFNYVVGDKAYAAALLSVKSTNYDAVWVTVASERRGVLSHGFNSRFIDAHVFLKTFSGGEAGVFKLAFGAETSAELRGIADRLVKGE